MESHHRPKKIPAPETENRNRKLWQRTGSARYGIVLGLLLAAGTGKILSGLLYEVGALDPVAFTFAPLILAIAALFATWLPARRATRISPMAAPRME